MEILSPAKINLYLEVVGKRPDGYHDLCTLMCPVSLTDTVRIRTGGSGIRIRCAAAGVPQDESNLAWRAAAVFCAALDGLNMAPPAGVDIELEKRIPVGGGLGGGSSNAASVLLGLNRMLGRPLAPEKLAGMAAGLGADVPFFLLQTPALATGIGDRLVPYLDLPRFSVLIVDPGFSISTALVYGKLNLALTKCHKRHKNFAFRKQKFHVPGDLCNDLETVVEKRYPAVSAVKTALLQSGARGALMTGSGSCVFGLFDRVSAAETAGASLSRTGAWRAYVAEMIV